MLGGGRGPLPSCNSHIPIPILSNRDNFLRALHIALREEHHKAKYEAGGFELVKIVDTTDQKTLTGFEYGKSIWWRMRPGWLGRWC